MNDNPQTPAALERALAQRLEKLLAEVGWLQGVRVERNQAASDRIYDLQARFKVPRGPEIELWVDVQADPRPSRVPHVGIDREFEGRSTKRVKVQVFAAPNISPRMAEVCESHGWSWFDLAGNCRISVPELLHLQRSGIPPAHSPPKPKANLGTKEAARVIRALLSRFNAKRIWTQGLMRKACEPQVSVGLVNKVINHLLEESFLNPHSDGGFRLDDPVKLLTTWRDAYRFDRHERLGYFTLLHGHDLQKALALLDGGSGGFAAYAAFSAADFQAPHVRQPKTWLYVADHQLDHFAKLTEAIPVDTGERLVVLVPSDEGVFFLSEDNSPDGQRLRCTNPVQTYVDLWHCGGRGKEAAEALLEQNLKPAWKACGYKV